MVKQYNWLLTGLVTLLFVVNIEAEEWRPKRAIFKQFPYQVYFEMANNSYYELQWTPMCSGTIISKNAIVTTASCLDIKFDLIRIYFGAVNISNPFEIGQTRLIVNRPNFIVHEEYDAASANNNIAIMKLPLDLEFNEYVQAALLPNKAEITDYAGQEMIIAGWPNMNLSNQSRSIGTSIMQFFKLIQKGFKWLSNKVVRSVANLGSPIVAISPNEPIHLAVGMFNNNHNDNTNTRRLRPLIVGFGKFLTWMMNIVPDIRTQNEL